MSERDPMLRIVLDMIGDGIVAIDATSTITMVNRQAQDIWKYEEWELIGQRLEMLMPEHYRAAHAAGMQRYQEGKVARVLGRAVEFEGLRKDGTVFPLSVYVKEVPAGDQQLFVAAVRDLGEHQRAEAIVRQYATRLQQMREIVQGILASRTPEEIAQIGLQYLRQFVPCQRVSIVLFDHDAHTATILATHRNGGTWVEEGARLLPGKFEIIGALGPDTALSGSNGKALQIDSATPAAWTDNQNCSVSLPIRIQNELFGSLDIEAAEQRDLTPEHTAMVREIADLIGIALQQARLFEQVRLGHERLQALSRQLMEVQENERRHIARELHDEIGQALTALKLNLQAVQRLPNVAMLFPHLIESVGIVERVLQQVRTLSLDLRPALLDDFGLVSALRWFIDRQAQRAGLIARFTSDLVEERLHSDLETACFRITQEALTNVVRHARATQVSVELRQRNGELHLLICDDGIGFDVQAVQMHAARGMSLGLLGMQERALLLGGEVDFESAPARGTSVHARFPMTYSLYHGGE